MVATNYQLKSDTTYCIMRFRKNLHNFVNAKVNFAKQQDFCDCILVHACQISRRLIGDGSTIDDGKTEYLQLPIEREAAIRNGGNSIRTAVGLLLPLGS